MTTANEYAARSSSKVRGYGYSPVNAYQEGMDYHHMHLNNDPDIGIWIPKSLHRFIYHNSRDGHGMKEINKTALLWLACQSTIPLDQKFRKVYSTDYTDDQFIEAVRICLRKTTVTSAEVARELGCTPNLAKDRLKKLAKCGKITQSTTNTTLCFKSIGEENLLFQIKTESGECVGLFEEGKVFDLNGLRFVINRVEEPEAMRNFLSDVSGDV